MTEKMNRSKISLLIAYVIAIILAGTYLYVLYLSAHPVVSDEYRAFYMDHTLRYMVEENDLVVSGGQTRFLDGKEDSDSTFYGIGKGWLWDYTGHKMENTGYCYTGDENNYLYFMTKDASDVRKIKLHIVKTDVDSIEIDVNDKNSASYEIEADGTVEVEIREGSGVKREDGKTEFWVDIKTDRGRTVAVDSIKFE